jgi:hypothetical protein
MKKLFSLMIVSSLFALLSCGTGSSDKARVVINDIPFQTEKNLRIPYTLELWEYEKEGLVLERIIAIDDNSKGVLMTIEKADFPKIFKEPLATNPYVTVDKISNYYLSLQLPIPLADTKPTKVSHRFVLTDTAQNKTVTVEGAAFAPRLSETPTAIASPLKNSNIVYINQSTNGYHFHTLFFVNGKIYSGERFAFDSLRFKDDYTAIYKGDPKVNSSYFNYKDTIYAVADGTVTRIRDGRPENNGDSRDVAVNLKSIDEYGGNYLSLDIGNGRYAHYAHCVPGSFLVKEGDRVKEGQPIALLGNSGNSDAPHLHFEVTDGADLLFSNGVPFVLKSYIKNGDTKSGPATPTTVTNAMMEETTVIGFGN